MGLDGQHGSVAPHRIGSAVDILAGPGGLGATEVIANQKWSSARTKVVNLAGSVFFLAQTALQIRHKS